MFSGWSDSYGNVSPLTVKMDTDIVIQAIFTEKNYTLTISVGKDGGGTVDPSEGVHEYPAGKEVQLQAHPDEENGWEFKEWSTGETDPDITVTMDSNKTITAYFKMQSGIGGRQSGPDVFFSTFNNSVFEHSWNLLKPSQQ